MTLSGVDLVDGTRILDIKPFIPSYDAPAGDVMLPDWVRERPGRSIDVVYSDWADGQLEDMESRGLVPELMPSWKDLKQLVTQVLAAGRVIP